MLQNFEDQFKVVNQVRIITYPCLEFLPGNREVDAKHAEEIKEAIINGEKLPPILVDRKTKGIVDGQHRYEGFCLALEEGHEVTLEVIFNDYEDPVAEANEYNTTNKHWTTKDYIFSGIALNRPQYIIIEQFCREHRLLMWGNRPKYESAIVMLFGNTLADGVKNLPEITEHHLELGKFRYKIVKIVIETLGESNRVAFFQKGALKALFKLVSEIGDTEKVKDFLCHGINNRFSKPTKDGLYVWYQYYKNMYEYYSNSLS